MLRDVREWKGGKQDERMKATRSMLIKQCCNVFATLFCWRNNEPIVKEKSLDAILTAQKQTSPSSNLVLVEIGTNGRIESNARSIKNDTVGCWHT